MPVLITGAGRGIGRVVALAYAKEGAFLALCARTESEITETIESAEVLGAVPRTDELLKAGAEIIETENSIGDGALVEEPEGSQESEPEAEAPDEQTPHLIVSLD